MIFNSYFITYCHARNCLFQKKFLKDIKIGILYIVLGILGLVSEYHIGENFENIFRNTKSYSNCPNLLNLKNFFWKILFQI